MFRKIISIGIILLLISSILMCYRGRERIGEAVRPKETYQLIDPIRIDDDEEIEGLAFKEGWEGDGTSERPFLIEGYEINGEGHGYGIFIGNTTAHFIIRENLVHGARDNEQEFFQNTGIYIYNSKNGIIEKNSIIDCETNGIWIRESERNTISNNILSKNTIGLRIDGNNNSLEANHASENSIGILLNGPYNKIIRNNVIDSVRGISITGPTNNIIVDNIFTNSKRSGLFLLHSDENIIENNTSSNNGRSGFYIRDSHNNSVRDNQVFGNARNGIHIFESVNNTVVNNNISRNVPYGIYLRSTINNTIKRNTILNNAQRGMFLTRSYDNSIFHNKLINNPNHAWDDGDNYWDGGDPEEEGKGGNYWSDYQGNDRGDGIGNISYNISGDGNRDNYPWVDVNMMEKMFEEDVYTHSPIHDHLWLIPIILFVIVFTTLFVPYLRQKKRRFQ